MNEELIIHILDIFGVAVFAASGALVAGRKRMDIFGAIVQKNYQTAKLD